MEKTAERKLVGSVLHPDIVTQLRILEALCEGPKQWKEIKSATQFNPGVLSRMLKIMVEEGWVVRDVQKTFPTKVTYQLNEESVQRLEAIIQSLEVALSKLRRLQSHYIFLMVM